MPVEATKKKVMTIKRKAMVRRTALANPRRSLLLKKLHLRRNMPKRRAKLKRQRLLLTKPPLLPRKLLRLLLKRRLKQPNRLNKLQIRLPKLLLKLHPRKRRQRSPKLQPSPMQKVVLSQLRKPLKR